MISIARILGAPLTVPAGKQARTASSGDIRGATAGDARDQVHHMRILLDLHELRDAHAAGLRYTPDIVAPEVYQHQVLGALLGVGQ